MYLKALDFCSGIPHTPAANSSYVMEKERQKKRENSQSYHSQLEWAIKTACFDEIVQLWYCNYIELH